MASHAAVQAELHKKLVAMYGPAQQGMAYTVLPRRLLPILRRFLLRK